MKNLDEKIEPYILGELPENESKAFELAMAADEALARSVADHRLMIERLEALRLRNKVKKALSRSDMSVATIAPLNRMRVVLAIAASFILLVSAFWFFTQNTTPVNAPKMADQPAAPTHIHESGNSAPVDQTVQQEQSTQKTDDAPVPKTPENQRRLLALAVQYHQNPSGSTVREAIETQVSSGAKTAGQSAAEAFEQHQFARCALLLRPDSLVIHDDLARNLRANARFQIGQYAGAAADFTQLQKSFQFKHDARWNFLLCQLAMGRLDLVKKLLAEMTAEPDFPFYTQALALKKSL